MNLSWGTGIAIFYTTFVCIMVGMVVYSKTFDHSLVVDNYYEEDLAYQTHLDKINNSRSLAVDLDIRQEGQAVVFQFPAEFSSVSGEILFYRADDKSKDFIVKIAPDGKGLLSISTENLAAGRWTMKVNWEGDGKAFFREEEVVL